MKLSWADKIKGKYQEGLLMDWDDEYNNGYDDMSHSSQEDGSMPDKGSSEGGLDPMGFPENRYP